MSTYSLLSPKLTHTHTLCQTVLIMSTYLCKESSFNVICPSSYSLNTLPYICIILIFVLMTHVTMFIFNESSNCTSFWPFGLLQVYIFDYLLKRNIVKCIIRPKINIVQIDLACPIIKILYNALHYTAVI